MKIRKLSKFLVVAMLGAVCALGISACSSDDNGELKSDTGLTGGVAATVNGTEIEEDRVTRAINNIRINNDYTTDDAWKQYLSMYGYTPASLRYTILGQLIDEQLVRQCADQLGVTTDDDEIQTYVEKMSSQYSSEDKWLEAVDKAGWDDEAAYRDALRYSILHQKITDIYEEQADAELNDNAKLLEEVQDDISTYNGAKRISHIQFSKEDAGVATDVYNKLRSGEITWNAAVAEYSTDEDTKEANGDMGWDSVEEFSSSYKEVIDELVEIGQYSEPTQNKYGYEIVTLTDMWDMPEEVTSLNQVPGEFVNKIREDAAEKNGEELYEDWLTSLHETNTIEVNPMPENAPYNVEMDYTQEEADEINEKALNELVSGAAETEEELTDVEAEVEGDEAILEDAEAIDEDAHDPDDGEDHTGHNHD